MTNFILGIKNVKLDKEKNAKNVKLDSKSDIKNVKLFDFIFNITLYLRWRKTYEKKDLSRTNKLERKKY